MSEQVAQWDFGNLFSPFGFPEMIVVDAHSLFYYMFKKKFKESLFIQVHSVERGIHKADINEGFHRYLNKVQKINYADKGSLHQWLQIVFFTVCLECRPCIRN